MSKERVCANTPALPHSAILEDLPCPAASAAMPTISPADEPSPIRSLYFRWRALKSQFAALTGDCGEEAYSRLFEELQRVEKCAADFEPQTPEDWALKIIFADDGGDMDLNVHQKALVDRAYALAGIVPLGGSCLHRTRCNTSAEPEMTPIQALYRDWRELTEYAEAQSDKLPEHEFDALCDRLRAYEEQIVALPCLDQKDALAKMIVSTVNDFADGQALLGKAREEAMSFFVSW